MFATAVLLVDALVGERGLVATTKARRQAAELQASVDEVRAENARLRETANRLESDPSAIESLARESLGLIRPGEVLVVVKDVKPSAK
jgi:cell division protein FtsB